MAPPLIELDGVSKSFDGGASFALRDVSLAVEAKSFIALVGASGSGKTTALKIINRLIEPDRGEVRLDGVAVRTLDAPLLRRRIGYVFQDIGLFPHMTIGENIGITPQLLGWPRAEIDARVAELLDLVELPQSFAARLPARALRRPAPARRRRPRHRRAAARHADGRAVRRARSGHPRRARHRVPRAARPARPHHHHGHPRRAGGGAARRPHRGDGRRPHPRRRHARPRCSRTTRCPRSPP